MLTADDAARLSRYRSTAATWFTKAASTIHAARVTETRSEVRWLLGYEAQQLLVRTLDDAEYAAWCLSNDEQVDDCLRAARKLVETLEGKSRQTRRLRHAGLLSSTAGRTPEEAALFAAKALELGAET